MPMLPRGEALANLNRRYKDGKPTNKPVDDFNHFIDSLRYALEPFMKRKRSTFG